MTYPSFTTFKVGDVVAITDLYPYEQKQYSKRYIIRAVRGVSEANAWNTHPQEIEISLRNDGHFCFYDGKYFDTLYAKIKQNDIAVKNEPIHDV